MRILIILPIYNEAENLTELVRKILDVNKDLSILMIDDNSTDDSAQISLGLSNNNPTRIFFIQRRGLRGRGITVREGYKFALSQGFECVVEMDADLSHNPIYIPLLLNAAKGTDIVIGSRYVKGGKIEGRSFYRNIISRLANAYLRFLLDIREIRDITSGYRCISVEFLKRLNLDSLESKGPELLEEIIFKHKDKIRIKEIPIVFKERVFGKTKFSFLTALRCFLAPLRWQIVEIKQILKSKYIQSQNCPPDNTDFRQKKVKSIKL